MSQRARLVAPSPREAGAGRPARRASRERISREDIILAAVEVVRLGGYRQMTIRGVAGELGVAPMSLYRHIRDKDDLLDEVVERLLAPGWRPSAAADEWQAWVTEAANRLRRFLVSDPAALRAYLRRPAASPASIERTDAMTAVIQQAGAGEKAARRACLAVHAYTIGFAALEASQACGAPDGADAGSGARQVTAQGAAGLFTEGLRCLLDGIGMRAGQGLAAGGNRVQAAVMTGRSFKALVVLDPAASEDAALRDLGGMRACLVEPSRCTYFPAVISLNRRQPRRSIAHALITIGLGASEARAFFAPGQRFTIWADADVGHTVRARGLAGYGVICQPASPPAPRGSVTARPRGRLAQQAAMPGSGGAARHDRGHHRPRGAAPE